MIIHSSNSLRVTNYITSVIRWSLSCNTINFSRYT
nr:MAG TPA: potassium channel accessory sub-unit protein 4 [Caudoviricetes sp.]